MSHGISKNVKKLEDGTGERGTIFEKLFCMLFAVRGYTRGLNNFQLKYQVPEKDVGKFDDIVFDAGQGKFQVFQLKHVENYEAKEKISNNKLFNESFNANYNLLKYIKSLKELISNKSLQGDIKMAVVLTTIDFDLKSDNKLKITPDNKGWCDRQTEIQLKLLTLNNDAIFDTSKHLITAKYYKFDGDNIIDILMKQKNTLLNNLVGNQKLSKEQQNWKKFLENITEDEMRNVLLKRIIYAVNQPNDTGIEQIIKKEIMEYFQLQNVDTVYNALETAFRKWCSTKTPLNDPSSSSKQHIIGFEDVKIFFEKLVKKISFGVTAPTKSFTGRLGELEYIKNELEKQHDLVISQVAITLAITGLGGIGKTELTRQFIYKYGQSDFYGRVIWIEAESDESVKNSFTRLAEKIKIDDREKKSLLTIIDDVFEYFNGVKVLFVFDNFDQNTEENEVNPGNNVDKNFVIHCQKQASALPKENRPYFIFTSRNRKCLPGVKSLNLKVLIKKDAQDLILLCVKNSTREDAENLAEKLQYFPLALKQAIAYINEQNEIKSETGGQYEIKDYLKEFDKKTKELLNFKYTNDFNENEKTTFLTWNVTLEAIQKDKTHGKDAIQVLKMMSYLYADKIDTKMFLTLFDTHRCGKAFLLLNKYSLITKIENSTFYQIHRLVQAVVQLKFKNFEEKTLDQVWRFINLELYDKFPTIKASWFEWFLAKKDCTVDEYLHYNNLSTYMKNYSNLNRKFNLFFDIIHNSSLCSPVFQDDVETIKALKLSKDVLEIFAKENFGKMVQHKNNQTIKYFIENGYVDLNYSMSLLLTTVNDYNPDLLKYFVEKFDYFSELTIFSTEFICDIKQGKSDSLLKLIESEESETNVTKLKESLFFASLYNQESIVKLLIDKNVQPDYKIEKWNINYAPIVLAAGLGYSHIVKILLKPFDNLEFWKDILEMIFEFLKIFADTINGVYISRDYTDLYYATNFDVKVQIADFLLRRYSDYSNFTIDQYALLEVLKIIEDDPVKYSSFKNILGKMRSNVLKCEFISSLVKIRIDNQFHETLEMLKKLNNFKDETKLISCVRDLTMDFVENSVQVGIVEKIVNGGVDVDATDQNGNNALYYAVDLYEPDVFEYLLPKTNSVHENILKKAIKKDRAAVVEEIIPKYFNKNYYLEKQGCSIFDFAVRCNAQSVKRYLLNA